MQAAPLSAQRQEKRVRMRPHCTESLTVYRGWQETKLSYSASNRTYLISLSILVVTAAPSSPQLQALWQIAQ